MSYSYTEKRRIRKNFGRLPKVMELPKLIETQLESYSQFLQNGSKYVRTYYDAYKNSITSNEHFWIDSEGNTGQISTTTVIALFCEPYIHPLQLHQ